jgi:hypothetical protein
MDNDKLAAASDTPDIRELAGEYIRSLDEGYSLEKIAEMDDVRYTRWDSQSEDGKKHDSNMKEGSQAFPWDGASDTRIPLADSIINDSVDMLTTAFSRSSLKVGGTEVGDAEQSAVANNIMRWQLDTKLYHTLNKEAELLAQYGNQYGWACLHVGWEQKSALKPQVVTMEEIVQMSANMEAGDPLKSLPEMIMDETQEGNVVEIIESMFPGVEVAKARSAVKELREDGETIIPQAYVAVNQPTVAALKPWEEISFPPETVDLQSARVIFRRMFLTEAELRAKVVDEAWDEDWVDEVIKTAGKSAEFHDFSQNITDLSINKSLTMYDNLVEVVYAYSRQVDKNGVPGIYYTIFNPLMSNEVDGAELYAKHELLDYSHCRYPFVEYRRERLKRRITESRGVPDICRTWQNEIKTQRDSIFDSTSFETLPPIMVSKRLGLTNKIGPAVQLPVTKPGEYEFMRPPARTPNTAMNLIEIVAKQADEYFGRSNPAVPATQTQLKQQRAVNNWLTTWTEAYQQMFALTLQYLSVEEMQRISGAENVPQMGMRQFDFVLKFDVREMDTEYVNSKLSAIAQYVVPQDVGGVLDRNKLVAMITRAISPDIAEELIVDKSTASQKMYEGVKSDIGSMMLGMEPQYVENDPAAQTKMQYAQEIVGRNPKAQAAMQGDELFTQLFENYSKNLQMSVMQQQNAEIGRIGVNQIT